MLIVVCRKASHGTDRYVEILTVRRVFPSANRQLHSLGGVDIGTGVINPSPIPVERLMPNGRGIVEGGTRYQSWLDCSTASSC